MLINRTYRTWYRDYGHNFILASEASGEEDESSSSSSSFEPIYALQFDGSDDYINTGMSLFGGKKVNILMKHDTQAGSTARYQGVYDASESSPAYVWGIDDSASSVFKILYNSSPFTVTATDLRDEWLFLSINPNIVDGVILRSESSGNFTDDLTSVATYNGVLNVLLGTYNFDGTPDAKIKCKIVRWQIVGTGGTIEQDCMAQDDGTFWDSIGETSIGNSGGGSLVSVDVSDENFPTQTWDT